MLYRGSLLASLALLSVGCSFTEPQLPIPIEQLARDIYVEIGGQQVHAPLIGLVFITGHPNIFVPNDVAPSTINPVTNLTIQDLAAKKISAVSPLTNVVYLRLNLRSFQYLKDTKADTTVPTTGLCPLLKQQWASEFCNGSLTDGQNAFMPDDFILADEVKLKTYRPHIGSYVNSSLSIGEAALELPPYTDEPSVHCGVDRKNLPNTLCTVVMRIDKDLLAIWSANRYDNVPVEAKSIRLFVKYGLGENENYEALKRELRQLHPVKAAPIASSSNPSIN